MNPRFSKGEMICLSIVMATMFVLIPALLIFSSYTLVFLILLCLLMMGILLYVVLKLAKTAKVQGIQTPWWKQRAVVGILTSGFVVLASLMSLFNADITMSTTVSIILHIIQVVCLCCALLFLSLSLFLLFRQPLLEYSKRHEKAETMASQPRCEDLHAEEKGSVPDGADARLHTLVSDGVERRGYRRKV
jgi:hypothetical protein